MTAADTSFTTPLPTGVTEQAVIQTLQNHDTYIKTTCPNLVSQTHICGTPGPEQPCVYSITDKRPLGQTTFKMTLKNVAQGVEAVIEGRAPTGSLTVHSKWRVADGKLHETVGIESNLVTKVLVKGNVEKSHPNFHHVFFAFATAAGNQFPAALPPPPPPFAVN
ncbi:hypothetical protein F5Y14DRAFT_454545 [Nemania sp. NC0429]|nr:hypothetical protein F5Y14DRAFT_454545 [Nemania sp. NC0429]